MTSVSPKDNPAQEHLHVGEPVVSVVAGDKRLTWALFIQFSDRLCNTAWLLALSSALSIILNGVGHKQSIFQKAIIISKLWMEKQRKRLASILSVVLPTSRPKFSSLPCGYKTGWRLCTTYTEDCFVHWLSGRLYMLTIYVYICIYTYMYMLCIYAYKSHHYILLLL